MTELIPQPFPRLACPTCTQGNIAGISSSALIQPPAPSHLTEKSCWFVFPVSWIGWPSTSPTAKPIQLLSLLPCSLFSSFIILSLNWMMLQHLGSQLSSVFPSQNESPSLGPWAPTWSGLQLAPRCFPTPLLCPSSHPHRQTCSLPQALEPVVLHSLTTFLLGVHNGLSFPVFSLYPITEVHCDPYQARPACTCAHDWHSLPLQSLFPSEILISQPIIYVCLLHISLH